MKIGGGYYCNRALRMNHNVLLPNGDVVLCCMDFGMQHVLGNLKRQSYEEILKLYSLLDMDPKGCVFHG